MNNKAAKEKEGRLQSIAWASAKLSGLLFAMRLLVALLTNGVGRTLERWYVEAGYLVLLFVLVFLALILISHFEKKQVENEKGTEQK